MIAWISSGALARTVAAAALSLLLCAPAWAGSTTTFTFQQRAYPGSQERRVKVYLPSGLTGPAPLVMALHGCEETEDNVLRDWGMTAAADRFGFILVAPFITRYDQARNTNCWGFWLDGHRHQGAGEPEDLHQIAREVEARFSVDGKRRYVTGLSSGGAMSVVVAVTHNEYWAAAASAAGLPYGEDSSSVSFSGCPGSATFHPVSRVVADMHGELNSAYPIPLMVLQNQHDCTVLETAGRNLRDAQLKVFGGAGHDSPTTAQATRSACAPSFGAAVACEQVRYSGGAAGASRSVVETVFYDGPTVTPDTSDKDHGHYWIGGERGRDGPYAMRRGPSFPDIVWDFFSRHPRDASEESPPALSCATHTDSPVAHLAAGRAVRGGFFLISALSNGDRASIGLSWDSWSRVTLHEGAPGRWYAGIPAGCAS